MTKNIPFRLIINALYQKPYYNDFKVDLHWHFS